MWCRNSSSCHRLVNPCFLLGDCGVTVGCCCLALSFCSRQNAAFSFLTLCAPCPYIRRVTVLLLPDAH